MRFSLQELTCVYTGTERYTTMHCTRKCYCFLPAFCARVVVLQQVYLDDRLGSSALKKLSWRVYSALAFGLFFTVRSKIKKQDQQLQYFFVTVSFATINTPLMLQYDIMVLFTLIYHCSYSASAMMYIVRIVGKIHTLKASPRNI